jgi:hypothetical protein
VQATTVHRLAPAKGIFERVGAEVDTKVRLAEAGIAIRDMASKTQAKLCTGHMHQAPLLEDLRSEG